MRKLCIPFIIIACITSCSKVDFSTYDLKCEGLAEPLAIDSSQPHFSWKIQSSEEMVQDGYEIQVASSEALLKKNKADLWMSGHQKSSGQIMIGYDGKALASRQLCWWRVRVWDGNGKKTRWSGPQRFAVGILAPDTIKGEFIGMVSENDDAPLLRKRFDYDGKSSTAFLHVNSMGYHEVYINGMKVGDAVLTPAVSQLDKRSLINTYDVTSLLHKGSNEIVLCTAYGWFRTKAFGLKPDTPLVRAELDILGDNGWECILGTGADWQAATSGYRDNGRLHREQNGETIDARLIPASFAPEDLDKLEWSPVTVKEGTGAIATPQMCELCKIQETVCGVSVKQTGDSCWTVDLGRVANGLFEATISAPAGSEVFVKVLDEEFEKAEWRDNFGKYTLICSGADGGDRFVGKFCTNIFRYVRFEGLAQAPDPASVKVHRVRTDYAPAATFECSDPDIQSIHDMIRYTMENLAFNGYMVDCANLERLGYGGDGNASTLSLQTMFDVAPLYVNWLEAWNDATQEDGGQPHTAPCPWAAGGGPYWCTFITQAPWRTYMSYADMRMLGRCYEKMKLSLEYVHAHTSDGLLRRWPDTSYRGWYLGDWLAPKGIDVSCEETVTLVTNCAICQQLADLAEIARLLGRPEEERSFRAELKALRTRIHEVFYHPETGTYGTGTQLDMSYPLLVGVVPEDLRGTVTASLIERTDTIYGGHLGVGLVGVPVLTEWATLAHQADFIYGMLKKRDYPGYLYMIDNGATGTWEDWRDARSHFHNCYNGIGSWFYQALGGIIPLEPGYKKVLIDPQMPKGLDWVKVTKETPYGTIKVSWDNTGGKAEVTVEAPVGVTVTRP